MHLVVAVNMFAFVFLCVFMEVYLCSCACRVSFVSCTFPFSDERKLKYNSLDTGAYAVSAEDIEAYKLTKARADDPMAAFIEEDD